MSREVSPGEGIWLPTNTHLSLLKVTGGKLTAVARKMSLQVASEQAKGHRNSGPTLAPPALLATWSSL
jgi:hypothetical protein